MIISLIIVSRIAGVKTAISARDLEVRYGDLLALSGLTLEVATGASLAVVGANGSGKSTLLGALAGLHKPTSGSASVIEAPPALVLQVTEVASGLPITVRDAVKLARYPSVGLFRRFRAADKRAVAQALERMQVADLASTPLHALSGGQRQRVLMAQGLAQQSRILLLDEPMTGLDQPSRQVVIDVIKEEVAADRTVVMTTHSLADARECDLVLLLKTTAVAFGSPSEVLTEPNLRRAFGHQVISVGDDFVLDDHHVH